MHTFFTASDFLPTKWSTTDEKAVFGNNLLHFMLTGFLAERFTEKLYARLSMCFGHIAPSSCLRSVFPFITPQHLCLNPQASAGLLSAIVLQRRQLSQ
jgi:hypothetical protein